MAKIIFSKKFKTESGEQSSLTINEELAKPLQTALNKLPYINEKGNIVNKENKKYYKAIAQGLKRLEKIDLTNFKNYHH